MVDEKDQREDHKMVLQKDGIPDGIQITYTMKAPDISEIKKMPGGNGVIISLSNRGEIVVSQKNEFVIIKNLPEGVVVDTKYDVVDLTSPKDLATLEPTKDAGEIVVGLELPGLEAAIKRTTRESLIDKQVIPSIYGDLVWEDAPARSIQIWRTVDSKIVIYVNAHDRTVTRIDTL